VAGPVGWGGAGGFWRPCSACALRWRAPACVSKPGAIVSTCSAAHLLGQGALQTCTATRRGAQRPRCRSRPAIGRAVRSVGGRPASPRDPLTLSALVPALNPTTRGRACAWPRTARTSSRPSSRAPAAAPRLRAWTRRRRPPRWCARRSRCGPAPHPRAAAASSLARPASLPRAAPRTAPGGSRLRAPAPLRRTPLVAVQSCPTKDHTKSVFT